MRAARLAETETCGKSRRRGGPRPELPPAGAVSSTPGCAGDWKDHLEEEGVDAGAGRAVRSEQKLSGRETEVEESVTLKKQPVTVFLR